MLKSANTSIEEALRLFNGAGVATGLLVPTQTGLGKSIMDATLSFRDFLRETGVHDYAMQTRGAKEYVPANLVLPDSCIKTKASLYRPKAKPQQDGDPRIWFYKLAQYCKPTDLLAVVAYGGELYAFNMSNRDIVRAFGVPGSYPHEILLKCSEVISPEARELLDKLKQIHGKGFVSGVKHGDTDVGMTLEFLLGIEPNADKTADYKGIELKSSRKLGKSVASISKTKKVTLFTNTPDWKRSKFSAVDILRTFGYVEDGRLQLYCTISNQINPQGLYLESHDEIDLINKAKTERYSGDVAVWALETLKTRLAEKHRETFWVQASSEVVDGKEYFRYDFVRHTRKPNTANLASLFDAGIITLDYAMHIKPNGGVRDHGYLFRTTSDKFPHIFPIERVYDLSK